jgi:dual specificity protein phosphatase-like protein
MRTAGKLLLIAAACCVGLLWWALARLDSQEPNFTRIEDGLYLGGSVVEPPPGTRAVLNLCEKEDPYHVEVQRWEPIADSEPAPSIDWLRRAVDFVDSNRRQGRTTFVHCRNGVSRSGMVVTAYLMFEKHWTRDEALAYIRSKRPITRPNPAFMRRLTEWEHVLQERP